MKRCIALRVGLTVCGVGMLATTLLYTGCETTGGPPPAMLGMSSAGYAGMAANPSLSAQQRAVAAGMSHIMSAEAQRQHELEMVRTAQSGVSANLQVGQSHPQFPHVIYQGQGKWKPTRGYRWVNPHDPADLSVQPIPPPEKHGIELYAAVQQIAADGKISNTVSKFEDAREFYRNSGIIIAADQTMFGGRTLRLELKDQEGHSVASGAERVAPLERSVAPGSISYVFPFNPISVKDFSENLASQYQKSPSGVRRYLIEFYVDDEKLPRKSIYFTINHDDQAP